MTARLACARLPQWQAVLPGVPVSRRAGPETANGGPFASVAAEAMLSAPDGKLIAPLAERGAAGRHGAPTSSAASPAPTFYVNVHGVGRGGDRVSLPLAPARLYFRGAPGARKHGASGSAAGNKVWRLTRWTGGPRRPVKRREFGPGAVCAEPLAGTVGVPTDGQLLERFVAAGTRRCLIRSLLRVRRALLLVFWACAG